MSAKSTERVLVVPTQLFHELGVFQGFNPDFERYLPRLLAPAEMMYRLRCEVEDDSAYKQLIPYVVLRWRNSVFAYTRGKRGTETRLQAQRSIGVGGHISADDQNLFEPVYREAMLREVHEEVRLESSYREHCLGLINDDSTAVGRVHLGIVHLFDLDEPRVHRREQVLQQSGFVPLRDLRQERHELETWSQFVLDVLPNDGVQ